MQTFRRFLLLSLIFLTIIGIFSCQKEINISLPNNPANLVQSSPVKASLQGKVVDENNLPVKDATVKTGNNISTTDSNGLFFFKSVQLDKLSSLVTVEKTGYFKGLRNFSVAQGAYAFVKIRLVPKIIRGSIIAQNGGIISLPDNSLITIAGHSLVLKSNNQEYTGSVKLYASIIDPSGSNISDIVPGGFAAIDSQNRKVLLKSFGMMALELEGQNGEPLQLASGKTALIRINIPSSLQNSAPQNIPLWSLNESTGLWKQEGNGTKTATYFEGNISHFSNWNFDVPYACVFLELTLKNDQGLPLPHTRVDIMGLQNGLKGSAFTDTSGYVGGIVPNYQPLRLSVLNTCDQVIFTRDLGQLSQNTNLGTLTISLPTQYSMQINGTATDCNNQPVINGTAIIYFEGQQIERPILNGNFSAITTQCPGSPAFNIIAVDSVNNQQSSSYAFPVSGPVINTGIINACGTSTISTFSFTYDGTTYNLSSANGDTCVGSANLNPNGTGFPLIFGASSTQPNVYLYAEYQGGLSPGTYSIMNFNIGQLDNCNTCYYSTPFSVTITSYPPVGQFIQGTINAKLIESGTINHTITGTYRLKRVN